MSEKMPRDEASRHACASALRARDLRRRDPALADDITDKKSAVDQKINALSSQLAAHRRARRRCASEIDGVTARIRTLEANVGDVSLQLSTLEKDLSLHRERLAKLNKLFKLQSTRLVVLQRQYEVAVDSARRAARLDLRRRRAVDARVRVRRARRSTRCSTRSTTWPASRARTRRSRTRSRTPSSRCSTRASGRSRCASRSPAPRR